MKLNKRIVTVMIAMFSLFIMMVLYLTWYMFWQAQEDLNRPENAAAANIRNVKEANIVRGEIFDRNGNILAKNDEITVTEKVVNEETGEEEEREGIKKIRVYPEGSLFAHTVGYKREDSLTGIEKSYNDKYLGKPREKLVKTREQKKEYGADVYLTLDTELTRYVANNCFSDGNKGSVVIMNPQTGEVYCMYSNPSFNPDPLNFGKIYEDVLNDERKPLFARASEAEAPPGSTFKIVTAIAAFETENESFITEDSGSTKIQGLKINNAGGGNGRTDLKKAIAKSSNVYFSEISQKIGGEALGETAKKLGLQGDIEFDIPLSDSPINYDELNGSALAQTAFGQGELGISPFRMALVACAVANDGVLMQPYMVSKAVYEDESIAYKSRQRVFSQVTSAYAANYITEAMVECVESGTGTRAKVSGMRVAAKTGTAEASGGNHGWFIGFAPADNPQIAFCMMKENAGAGGGSVCAPYIPGIIAKARELGFINE